MSATTDSTAETMQIIQVADQMWPLFRQLPSAVQGGVLASLMAKWIVAHEVADDTPATFRLHDRIMRNHFRLIMKLIVAQEEQKPGRTEVT